jgi:hypothetical protein
LVVPPPPSTSATASAAMTTTTPGWGRVSARSAGASQAPLRERPLRDRRRREPCPRSAGCSWFRFALDGEGDVDEPELDRRRRERRWGGGVELSSTAIWLDHPEESRTGGFWTNTGLPVDKHSLPPRCGRRNPICPRARQKKRPARQGRAGLILRQKQSMAQLPLESLLKIS